MSLCTGTQSCCYIKENFPNCYHKVGHVNLFYLCRSAHYQVAKIYVKCIFWEVLVFCPLYLEIMPSLGFLYSSLYLYLVGQMEWWSRSQQKAWMPWDKLCGKWRITPSHAGRQMQRRTRNMSTCSGWRMTRTSIKGKLAFKNKLRELNCLKKKNDCPLQ